VRVFILGLDGLEHTLVERWKLKNLLQKVHGIYSVDEFKQVKNLSTSFWASFITGKYHSFDSWWTKRRLLKIAEKVIRNQNLLWKIARFIKPKLIDKTALQAPSLFDVIPNSIAVNVPVYNEKTEYHIQKLDALHFKGVKVYENTIWEIHQRRKEDVLKRVNSDWDLFMCWFDIADLIGHLHITHRAEMLRLYDEFDVFATFLRETIGDCVFLIVSDHGIEEVDSFFGEHTKTAFWSLNIETKWKPKSVIDFLPKIVEWVKNDEPC